MKKVLLILVLIFLTSMLFADYANNVFKWITETITYSKTHDIDRYGLSDYWQSAAETERIRAGDCEDLAILMMDKLNRRNIFAYLVIIRLKNEEDFWLHVLVGTQDYLYDPSNGFKMFATTIMYLDVTEVLNDRDVQNYLNTRGKGANR